MQPPHRPRATTDCRSHPIVHARPVEDAEDSAAAHDWLDREARGETSYVPLPEVRRRLRLTD